MDDAPYTLNYLGNFDTYGSNVASTGAPFLDEWAEDANIDSVTTPLSNSQSMYLNQQYAKANFGVGTLVYEVNQSTTFWSCGDAITAGPDRRLGGQLHWRLPSTFC